MTEENKDKKISADIYTDAEFMRERIKQRPINRKKFLRRTLLTVVLAVVFGVVACISFVFLEPLLNRTLNPEVVETPNEISLSETNPITEEIAPEDLIEESVMVNDAGSEAGGIIDAYNFGAKEYEEVLKNLKGIGKTAEKSIVYIYSYDGIDGWAEGKKNNARSGLILADNGYDYLILTEYKTFENADNLRAVFNDSSEYEADILSRDEKSSLCIMSVSKSLLSQKELDEFKPAKLGNSSASSNVGAACIAIGFPAAVNDSIIYGTITANTNTLELSDASYTLINTSMNLSPRGSGILINTAGETLGIFYPALSEMTSSVYGADVCVLGISSIKNLAESLSNGSNGASLGIYGADIPVQIRSGEGLPEGVYVLKLEMNSPAMYSGIQSGDVIKQIDNTPVSSYAALSNLLLKHKKGDIVNVLLMRQGADGYFEIKVKVTLK